MKVLGSYLMPHPPIIVPEVGMGEETKAAATIRAMHEVSKSIAHKKPETVVIISPHGPLFTDAINIRAKNPLTGNLEAFGAAEVKMLKANDLELVDCILEEAYQLEIPSVKLDQNLAKRFEVDEDADHGILIPVHFISQYYQNFKVVALTYGMLSEDALYDFGICIQRAAEKLERKIVVIASGDLSHHLQESETYGFRSEGLSFDKHVIDSLNQQAYLKLMETDCELVEAAGQCGKKSIEIMLGALDKVSHETRVHSYEGPFGVGYAVVSFEPKNEEAESLSGKLKTALKVKHEAELAREDDFVKLAREAVETFVKEGRRMTLPEKYHNNAFLDKTRGVFVSIHDRGGLRGCMGNTVGYEINLGNEIIAMAIKAAHQDPRFDAVEIEELESLKISVDILSRAELVTDKTLLDPKHYGIIVSTDLKQGLLLPDLAGIHSVEEQVKIALNKAGIKANETYTIHRFTVERHGK